MIVLDTIFLIAFGLVIACIGLTVLLFVYYVISVPVKTVYRLLLIGIGIITETFMIFNLLRLFDPIGGHYFGTEYGNLYGTDGTGNSEDWQGQNPENYSLSKEILGI